MHMKAERSRLYYTCTFLHVSFQAIRGTLENGRQDDTAPCWLDARLIEMLSGELKRCRREAAPFEEVAQALDSAIYHCGLLLAQCPAALNRRLCEHHLEAIQAPLKETIARLAAPPRAATPWQAACRLLGGRGRR